MPMTFKVPLMQVYVSNKTIDKTFWVPGIESHFRCSIRTIFKKKSKAKVNAGAFTHMHTRKLKSNSENNIENNLSLDPI